MQNVENLLSSQVNAESGKSTFDSSKCRMWKIYFRFNNMPILSKGILLSEREAVWNLLSIVVRNKAMVAKVIKKSKKVAQGKRYFAILVVIVKHEAHVISRCGLRAYFIVVDLGVQQCFGVVYHDLK